MNRPREAGPLGPARHDHFVLRIRMFGGLVIERNGTVLRARRSLPLLRLELLTRLIEAGPAGLPTPRLVHALYSPYYGTPEPDGSVFDEANGFGALADLIYRTRQQLVPDILERFDGNRLRLNATAAWIDAAEFLALQRSAAPEQLRAWACRHYRGPYLEGIPRSPHTRSAIIAAARARFHRYFDALGIAHVSDDAGMSP